MLRKYTVQMGGLARELEATLQSEGRPVPEFPWCGLSDLARAAVERIHRGTSAPIEEPEAFRGVSLAVKDAMAEHPAETQRPTQRHVDRKPDLLCG